MAPTVAEDGKTIEYYLKDSGYVYQSNFDGTGLKSISSTKLNGLAQVIWSPDNKKVISIYEDSKKYVYDYQTKKANLLTDGVQGVCFSPDSQKIAYQFQSTDGLTNNVSLANFDGTNWRSIFQTRLDKLIIEWPAPSKIYVRNQASSKNPGSLFAISPDSGNFSKVLADLPGLSVVWSQNGQKMLYQTSDQNGKNLKLYSANADGSNAKELPVATMTEKCVWSRDNQNVFCAVPQNLSQNAVWPDDYLAGKVLVTDDFYLIDISGQNPAQKIVAANSDQSFDAQNLILSSAEDYLFFINQKNGLLYSINLIP